MPRNTGTIPGMARGRRVRVRLFNGYDTADTEPQGWPADGKGACNWSISAPPHPYEIEFWKIVE